ncbi:metal ABC transporter solute-binding protein, Zn/Mn family [Halalkalibacter nanhaiisediminis]|uniref:Zinc transport system substrate-binding protein n=1 Tax=Halalkalibacter nanhaiisediminis TaxID=688079 RepID=A0A562QU84_9BACI|nr:zinc ABC transporter substrate-binding protein [Halalkalibacter nanhaiisediminis]TWI59686.1 zinc transport system substrate-binding protein [Halalkalibacter nanhaiisediminis]
MNTKLLLLIIGTLLIVTACGTSSDQNESTNEQASTTQVAVESVEEPLHIYTTVFALQDFIEKIGGPHVQVTNMIPVGVDAHTYEPTIREMIEVAESDAFVYSGSGMEGFVDSLKNSLRDEEIFMIEASQGVAFIEGDDDHALEHSHSHSHEEEHSHTHGDQDPHVWIDPIRSIQLAENIKNGLTELYPEEQEFFQNNFEQLQADLETLDAEFTEATSDTKRNQILVAHAGYTYWAERYDLKQVSITGFTPTNEPSQKQIQELMTFTKAHDIQHILFERNYSIQTAEMFKEEIGAEALYLYNLENLRDEEIAAGEDYFSLMRKNIETLKTVLN